MSEIRYEIFSVINGIIMEEKSTNSWQTAIDLWAMTSNKPSTSCWITFEYNNEKKSINSKKEISEWSDYLMTNGYNRIEKRIMNDMIEEREKELQDNIKKEQKKHIDFHNKYFGEMEESLQDSIINPKHYKMIPKEAYNKYPEGLEYIDLMEYILAHHKGLESHLLGQIFKYACRLGKKDADLQDARKIEWYASRLVMAISKSSDKEV